MRIWNPERPSVKHSTELRGHTGAIQYVAWNPVKEAELASCSADGTVRFWDVRSKNCVAEVKTGGEGFKLAWSPDGEVLMVGRKDDALLPIQMSGSADGGGGSGAAHAPIALAALPQPVQTNQTTFSHSGRELLLTTGLGSVKMLAFPGLAPLHTLNAHTSACFTLELCPRGKYLAVGGSDALISLWDTADWFPRHGLANMTGPVRSVSFTFDGAYVCGGSDEGAGVDVAHVDTGEYVHTVPTTHPAPCVAWHPARYWLAYSGDPMGLKIVGAAP